MTKSYGPRSLSFLLSKGSQPPSLHTSITSSLKLQIIKLITFWKAITMIHTLSKLQSKLIHTTKVVARRNLCPLNGRPRVSTNSNYHNFCKKTPNSTCKHNLESSHHKEQFAKISISKEFCSASYMQSKFCLKLSLLPLL